MFNLVSAKDEMYNLRDTVNSLITPDTVSGSLAKSFSDRIQLLKNHQKIWYFSSVFMAILAVSATVGIVFSIVGVFTDGNLLKLISDLEKNSSVIIWISIGLRVGILFPIYSIFVFCFFQYKQERSFEEEYAHKAAVANSLPNYVGLALDDHVKDQILSDSSKVIYNSPITMRGNANKGAEQKIDITSLNDLLGNLQNLIQKQTK